MRRHTNELKKNPGAFGHLDFPHCCCFIERMYSFDYNHVLWNNDDQLTIKMAFQLTIAPPSYHLCLQNAPLIPNQSNAPCYRVCVCVLAFKQIFWLIAKHFSRTDWSSACVCAVKHIFLIGVVIFHFKKLHDQNQWSIDT